MSELNRVTLRFKEKRQRDDFVKFVYGANAELLDSSEESFTLPQLVLRNLSEEEKDWVISNLPRTGAKYSVEEV